MAFEDATSRGHSMAQFRPVWPPSVGSNACTGRRVGPLLHEHFLDELRRDRLDVRSVRHLRIGHDRRRVGVDEDDGVALGPQAPCRPASRVVELRSPGPITIGPEPMMQMLVMSVRLGMAPWAAISGGRTAKILFAFGRAKFHFAQVQQRSSLLTTANTRLWGAKRIFALPANRQL